VPPRIGPRLIIFLRWDARQLPGWNPATAAGQIAALLGPADHLLLGVGLVTEQALLEAAYDDSAGITAQFNRNVLSVLHRELDPADFEHRALFEARREWIEMRLRARRNHTVNIRQLDLEVRFETSGELRTEISAKFTLQRLASDLAAADLTLTPWLPDANDLFALALARRSNAVD